MSEWQSSLDFLLTKECTLCIGGLYLASLLCRGAYGRARASWDKCQKAKSARVAYEKGVEREELETDAATGLQKVE